MHSKISHETGSKISSPDNAVNQSRRMALRTIILAAGAALGAGRAFADSGSSCFVAGTRVLLADGAEKAIEDVLIGDALLGVNQTVNIVKAYDRTTLGSRTLFAFNDGAHFVTAEHPFYTPAGWKSISPAATLAENPVLQVDRLCVGDRILTGRMDTSPQPMRSGSLLLTSEAAYLSEWIDVEIISEISGEPDLPLYNFVLDGSRSYHANGFVVHNKGGDGGDGGGDGGGGGGGSGGDSGGGSGGDSGGGSGGDDNSGSNSSGSNSSGSNSSGSNSSGSNSSGSNSGSSNSGSSNDDGAGHDRGDDRGGSRGRDGNSGPGSANSGRGNAASRNGTATNTNPASTGVPSSDNSAGSDGAGVGGVGL